MWIIYRTYKLIIILTNAIRHDSQWLKWGGVFITLGLTAYYAVMAIWYLFSPAFLDHMEPTIAVVSRIIGQGKPLYPSLDNAERYVEMYGPMVYIINLLFQGVSQDIIFSSKLAGVFLGISSL